jgi:hypothetical protein
MLSCLLYEQCSYRNVGSICLNYGYCDSQVHREHAFENRRLFYRFSRELDPLNTDLDVSTLAPLQQASLSSDESMQKLIVGPSG